VSRRKKRTIHNSSSAHSITITVGVAPIHSDYVPPFLVFPIFNGVRLNFFPSSVNFLTGSAQPTKLDTNRILAQVRHKLDTWEVEGIRQTGRLKKDKVGLC